jgi:DNA polymerase (family 10)
MQANKELARIFGQIAAALELLEANRFRINAHTRVARILKDMTEDVAQLVAAEPATAIKRLTQIQGIGKGTAEKIVEFLDHGAIAEHQELLEQVPSGVFDLLEIPGIGPKAAQAMWKELGISSIAELKDRLDTPELQSLPRMGKKTIENIRQAIAFSEQTQDRIPLGLALPIAQKLVDDLRQVPGVVRAEYAGSLRRGRETIGDLDFLVAADDLEAVRERFTTGLDVTQVLARGETKCSVRLAVFNVAVQADLRLVPETSYGAALMYFTGSKEHNVRLREIAIKQNKRLNEYGLFAGTDERPQDRDQPPLAVDEAAIYESLGLPFIEPERREDRGELEESVGPLIQLSDIRAELHSHTTASDGKLSIEEMARAAKERGYHTLAITDHSQSQVIANGLRPDRLRHHIEAIREANERIDGITLLAGSEVDILIDGRLDYDDDLLAELDIVVASPHASLRQDPETATQRLLDAIRHPLVHIIGHPTGRIINRREGLSPDMNALFEAAVEHDTALELNANWNRLDLRDTHLRAALAKGCKIAIDTDAHRDNQLDFMTFGILTARRASMSPESCVNTWSAEKLHSWLRSKR